MFAGQHISKTEARQLLGIPQNVPVLLFFGIVRPYKGLKYLIQSLAETGLQAEKPFLLVAGEIWQEKAGYVEQIQNLGLSGRVRLEDRYIPNEEVARYFCAADLLVAPYIQGTQSGAIKMALGFGLPVVASHSIADETLLALEGKGVVFATPEQTGELAAAISASLHASATTALVEGVGSAGTWDRLVSTIEGIAARLNPGLTIPAEAGEQPGAFEPGSSARP
jgi:glycosyltransferase involved in cell wall biosynthesis